MIHVTLPPLLHLVFFLASEPTFLVAQRGHWVWVPALLPAYFETWVTLLSLSLQSSHTLTQKLEYDGTYLLGFYEDRMQSWRQSPCARLAPGETHEEAATSILSENRVQLLPLEGQGPPPLLPQEGSRGQFGNP